MIPKIISVRLDLMPHALACTLTSSLQSVSWRTLPAEQGRGFQRGCRVDLPCGVSVALVTSSRNNREKESWQAIADGDFNEIVPRISVTTFKNIIYEYGYACRRPG